MNRPTTLFAYRKVFYEDRWHVRCINCSESAETYWNQEESWRLTLNTGESIVVSLPDWGYVVSSLPMGPEIVYGMNMGMESLPVSERSNVPLAQNYTIVVTDDDLSQLSLPEFMTEWPSTTNRAELIVQFESPYMESLPDVRAYQRNVLSGRTDILDDLDLCDLMQSTYTRIPVGLYLPASVEADGRTQPAVYLIKEWLYGDTAKVDVFTPNELKSDQSICLMREVPREPVVVLGYGTPL